MSKSVHYFKPLKLVNKLLVEYVGLTKKSISLLPDLYVKPSAVKAGIRDMRLNRFESQSFRLNQFETRILLSTGALSV